MLAQAYERVANPDFFHLARCYVALDAADKLATMLIKLATQVCAWRMHVCLLPDDNAFFYWRMPRCMCAWCRTTMPCSIGACQGALGPFFGSCLLTPLPLSAFRTSIAACLPSSFALSSTPLPASSSWPSSALLSSSKLKTPSPTAWTQPKVRARRGVRGSAF